MISEIANKITICLEKNKLISKKDTDVYNYGFEIMISTIITFAIVITLGIVMKSLLWHICIIEANMRRLSR